MHKSNSTDSLFPFKAVFLGSSTVGKTSIVNAIMNNKYLEEQQPTIGACFAIKKIEINDHIIRVNLWDTAGQERFRSLAPMYYRDANFALITFAVNDIDSFEATKKWYEGIVADCQTLPKIILIGNKIDLDKERVVSNEEGENLAKKFGAVYIEVSAKTKENIEKFIEKIGELAATELDSPVIVNEVIENNIEAKDKGCC